MTRLKYETLIPVEYGINIESDRYQTEGIRFLRTTDFDDGGELATEGIFLSTDDVPLESLLDEDDLLFCRSGTTVGKSYLHRSGGDFTFAGYLVRFKMGEYHRSQWMFYVSKSHFYWDWVALHEIISTIKNLNGEKYSNFLLPLPPDDEIMDMVTFLNKKTTEIDDSIKTEESKIELLKEYRQSLISEVVTGKIDIRDVQMS